MYIIDPLTGQYCFQKSILKICCCCSAAQSCLTLCDPNGLLKIGQWKYQVREVPGSSGQQQKTRNPANVHPHRDSSATQNKGREGGEKGEETGKKRKSSYMTMEQPLQDILSKNKQEDMCFYVYIVLSLLLLLFIAMWLVGSQFPNQGLNQGNSSESVES